MNVPDYSRNREGLVCLRCETIREDVSEEFLLPDSLPDLKKMLSASCTAKVTEARMETGGLRVEGECLVSLVYLTDAGRIRCAEFPARFRHAESGKEEQEGAEVISVPTVVQCDARILTPRKCGVRIGVNLTVCACICVPLGYGQNGGLTAEDEIRLETLEEEGKTVLPFRAEKTSVPFRTDLELDANQPGIAGIVESRIEPGPVSVSFRDGEAEIECEITFLAVIETENNRIARIRKTYTIEETVECPQCGKNASGFSTVTISGVRATAQNNNYGERRLIEIDADLDLCVSGFAPTGCGIVRDVYSTEFETVPEYGKVQVCTASALLYSSCTVNAKLSRADMHAENAGNPIAGTVFLSGIACRFDAEKEKLVCEGTANVTMFAEIPKENSRDFLQLKTEQPFKCEIDAKGMKVGKMIVLPCVSPLSFRADENDLFADFEVKFSVLTLGENEEEYVSSLTCNREKCKEELPGGSILLCYPDEEDTVWKIAKRYQTSRGALLAVNEMHGEQITKKVLLIPCETDKSPAFSGIL